MRSLTILLLALVTLPAGAQELGFAKDGFILELAAGLEGYAGLTPAAGSMFGDTPAGELAVALYADPMSKLQDAFGGSIHSYDNLGYHHDWLCYTDGGQRVWYLSEGGDTPRSGLVGWIVAEPSNPATDATYGCTSNPSAMLTTAGFPTIGATRDDLARHFGAVVPEDAARISYFLQEEIEADGDSYSLVRTAYYRLEDGVVDALSFSKWDSR